MKDRIRKALRRFLGLGELTELHTAVSELVDVRTDMLQLSQNVIENIELRNSREEQFRAQLKQQQDLVESLGAITRRHDESIIELFAALAQTRVLIEPMLRDYQAHHAQVVAASIDPLTGRPHREDRTEAFTAEELEKLGASAPAHEKTADEIWVEEKNREAAELVEGRLPR